MPDTPSNLDRSLAAMQRACLDQARREGATGATEQAAFRAGFDACVKALARTPHLALQIAHHASRAQGAPEDTIAVIECPQDPSVGLFSTSYEVNLGDVDRSDSETLEHIRTTLRDAFAEIADDGGTRVYFAHEAPQEEPAAESTPGFSPAA